VRRLAPRPLGRALDAAVAQARPAGLLASVQSAWPEVAGAVLAAATAATAERDGAVTVSCESGVWAQELELLAPDLVKRLNEALETAGEPARVERLRFVVSSGAKK
jgi:predicted nucleic acid-binding Zn ribbon protein